jgi:hypothetical protein
VTREAPIDIRRLVPEDREPWERMFRAHIAFYQRTTTTAELGCQCQARAVGTGTAQGRRRRPREA